MKITKYQQITHIMDNFDFNKVHKAMQALNWTWSRGVVPSIAELRSQAHELLCRIAYRDDEEGNYVSTGGFTAEKTPDGDLSLLFYVCQVEADSEEV